MARQRSPNREKAFEIYKEHGGNITNREIAAILNEDEKAIAVWKGRDKWNVVQQSKECCTTKGKGGQPGNKNAAGNGAPERNKNAIKTGEFEALFFDTLKEDERQLIGMIKPDKEQLLLQEIKLLTIRERRMLKRIDELQHSSVDVEKAVGMTAVKYKVGIEKDKGTDLTEYSGILGQIQSVEDALTRVQARQQRAIDTLHKMGIDDAKLKLELMKIELMMLKMDSQDNEIADDGFLDAMNAGAADLWGDADD